MTKAMKFAEEVGETNPRLRGEDNDRRHTAKPLLKQRRIDHRKYRSILPSNLYLLSPDLDLLSFHTIVVFDSNIVIKQVGAQHLTCGT